MNTNKARERIKSIKTNLDYKKILEDPDTLYYLDTIYYRIDAYNKNNDYLKAHEIPACNFWILSMDKILGLGRNPKNKELDELKLIMLDAFKYRCNYILISSTTEDINTTLLACRYFIVDLPVAGRTVNGLKMGDWFPDFIMPQQVIIYDQDESNEALKVLKLKKTIYDGEMF